MESSLKPTKSKSGQSLIELLVVIALMAAILPPLIFTLLASKDGKVQQQKRMVATSFVKESQEALRIIRESGWSSIATPGTYHLVPGTQSWTLASGTEVTNGFSKSIVIANVNRQNGQIVTSGGTYDPSTKKITLTVTWSSPITSSISSTFYMTRYLENGLYTQTTQTDFQTGITSNTQVTNTAGGEVTLANNTKAKWCSPEFSVSTIDLPDGPPVAVSAYANPSITIPNDVFVATSPELTSSIKMAYINVSANADPPVSTLQGIFTLNPDEYSSAGLIPSGIGIDNNFISRDIKYYKASSGNMYALIATDRPDKEIIAVQIKSGGTDSWQDSTNRIYRYWTFFNTRIYQGNTSYQPNQDYSPYNYGVSSLAILGDRGYATSGGYLYVFNLANIDSKSPSSGLDMIGCRIQLDGYDCNPSTSRIRKYGAGDSGSNWDADQAGQIGCMDGGAVSPFADTHISPISIGSTYVYVAVGAGADPELNIVNATNVPSSSSSPRINNSSCGTISSGNSGWKRVGQYDFNSKSGTQESANSVYAKSDGTRAYISSNGGVDANNDGQPDSYQFYIINTTNKSSPAFLSGSSSTGAQSGYYSGNSTNIQMFPRRSLTVLNGQRAVLVGQDGFPADATNPLDYQVLNIDTEVSPSFCGGIEFDSGFNDLTSVIEADADTFVYMVANTNEKQLKIIQGGPDGTYVGSGVYESAAFNGNYSRAFNRFFVNFTQPSNTTINFQVGIADPNPATGSCTTATFTFTGPDGSTSSYYTTNSSIAFDDDDSGYENPAQCMKYKAYLSTTDYNTTPVLQDVSINYSP